MKLVLAIVAKALPATEKKLRNSGARVAEGGAAFALKKKRCAPHDGLKKSQFQVHRRKRAIGTGALVEPAKIGFRAEAAAGNHGIVGVIEEVAQARLPHAAGHGGNFRRAKPQPGVQRANFIADAQFAEAPEAVPHVAANIDAIDAIVRQRIVLRVNRKRGVAGVRVRRKKPAALRAKRPEQLRLKTVGIPKQHIGSPFRTEPGY